MRTWLITGAGSGIGKEIARNAIVIGDCVAVTSRNEEKVKDLVALAPERVLPVALEVTDEASGKAAVEETVRKFGTLDVLVNNAGRGLQAPLEDTTSEDMHLLFETNYFGAVRMIQYALPYLRKSEKAAIVNVSSMGVHFDNAVGNAIYVSTKAALDMTTTVLRNEVRPFNIQVMLVEPGAFRTNFRVEGVTPHGERKDDLYKESYASVDSLKNNPFNQPGDPAKAGKIIVDQVNQEKIPEILVLGDGMADAEMSSLRERIWKIRGVSEIGDHADF